MDLSVSRGDSKTPVEKTTENSNNESNGSSHWSLPLSGCLASPSVNTSVLTNGSLLGC